MPINMDQASIFDRIQNFAKDLTVETLLPTHSLIKEGIRSDFTPTC